MNHNKFNHRMQWNNLKIKLLNNKWTKILVKNRNSNMFLSWRIQLMVKSYVKHHNSSLVLDLVKICKFIHHNMVNLINNYNYLHIIHNNWHNTNPRLNIIINSLKRFSNNSYTMAIIWIHKHNITKYENYMIRRCN